MAERIDSQSAKDLADKMLRYRVKHKMTQTQMAKKCNMSKASLNYVESGRMLPTKKMAMQIEMSIDETNTTEE